MSHLIQNAVFSAAEGAGWTGLGQAIPEEIAKNPAKIAALCNALYSVQPVPIYTQAADGSYVQVPGKMATARSDNGHVMGIVSDSRYSVENRQPVDIFEAFRDELAANNLVISHAAVLAQGGRVAVCAKLPEDHGFSVGGNPDDRVDSYLTLSTGYDGKNSTRRSTGSTRVVCANTLEYSLMEAAAAGKLRGIAASSRLERDTLSKLVSGAAVGESIADAIVRAKFEARAARDTFDLMSNTRVDAITLARYFGDVLGIDIGQLNHTLPDGRPAISTKSKNMLSALSAAYDSAPGSAWAHGSVWGALNAVTYYATHVKTCRDTSGSGVAAARYASNMDGDAAALKRRAFALAANMLQVAA